MKARPIEFKQPKEIARITICGAIGYTVTDQHKFIKPTPEQIANLKHILNIDVELLDEETEEVAEESTDEVVS